MTTTGSVQFALPLEEDRPSKHIAARGCGRLAQPNAPAAQKRRFLPPSYTEARFGNPTTPEEAQLYAELNRLDALRAKVKGARRRTAARFGSGPLTSVIRRLPSISLVMAFMSAVTWFIRTSMQQVQRRTQTRE